MHKDLSLRTKISSLINIYIEYINRFNIGITNINRLLIIEAKGVQAQNANVKSQNYS